MPTNNPVPSRDPSDLRFNAEQIDRFVNSGSTSMAKRLGGTVRTLAGINAEAQAAIDGINTGNINAAASAAAAAGSATSGASSAAAALVHKNAAEAAAEASGSVNFYDTKAAANAALAGLAANAIVEVFADESRNGRRTRYRKEGGVYVFKLELNRGKVLYVDTTAGSDSNSGLNEDAPLLTWATAYAAAYQGDTILFRGGTRIHASVAVAKKYLGLGSYGSNGPAIIDGSRPIAGTWTADPTYENVWYRDVTHEVAPDATNSGFCVWREDPTGQPVTLLPKWTAGSQALNRAFVSANPGYFTCHRQGSAAADPRSDTFSTSYRYYVYSVTEPGASGSTWYYAEARQNLSGYDGCIFRDLVVQRTAHKDMGGHNQNKMYLLEDVEFREAFMHGWVGGALTVRKFKGKCRAVGGDYAGGGGGLHLYCNTDGGFKSYVDDCDVDGFANNYYSHAGTTTIADHTEVFCRKLVSRNSTALAFAIGEKSTRGVHVDGFESFNDKGGFYLPVGSTVRNFRLRLKNPTRSAFSINGATGGSITAINGTIICDSASPGTLGSNQQASTDGNAAHVATINLVNVTAYNVVFNASLYLRQLHWNFTDCILGNLENSWVSARPYLSVSATNSQLGMYRRTLAEIQALTGTSGVDSTCVVPWVDQVFTKTIADASDLRYVNSGASIQIPSLAALDSVSFNTLRGLTVGDYIQVLDYNGAGGSHKTRLTVNTSGNNFTVDPPFPGDATTGFKTCNVAMFNRKLFPETVTLTAQFADDGLSALFSDASYLAAGTTVYFGGIGRRGPIGPRTLLTFNAATRIGTWAASAPVLWEQLPSDLTAYPALGVAGNARPAVPCSFKFPLRPVENVTGTPAKMTYTIDHALPVSLANSAGHENPASGGVALFTTSTANLLKDNSLWDSQGNKVTHGHIHHEIGEIDAGFAPLGPGDVLTVSAVAYVDEYAPQFASDPRLSGSAALRPNTRLADMRIGSLLP